VATTSDQLGLPPEFRNWQMTAESLRREFDKIRDDLLAQIGEDAGTEQLAILIHSTYPRH
jgi:hypothetical protein